MTGNTGIQELVNTRFWDCQRFVSPSDPDVAAVDSGIKWCDGQEKDRRLRWVGGHFQHAGRLSVWRGAGRDVRGVEENYRARREAGCGFNANEYRN